MSPSGTKQPSGGQSSHAYDYDDMKDIDIDSFLNGLTDELPYNAEDDDMKDIDIDSFLNGLTDELPYNAEDEITYEHKDESPASPSASTDSDVSPLESLWALFEVSKQKKAEADKAAATGRALSASTMMSAFLAEVASDASVSRVVSNERRPASDLSPTARPSATVEASENVEAVEKAEADKVAVTDPTPVPLAAKSAGPVSGSSPAATGKKASRSPAELEMLRLKDRRTLHSLAP